MPKIKPVSNAVAQFDSLPNSAQLRISDLAQLLNLSERSVYQRAKSDPMFPRARVLGPKSRRWQVGEIRAFMAAQVAA